MNFAQYKRDSGFSSIYSCKAPNDQCDRTPSAMRLRSNRNSGLGCNRRQPTHSCIHNETVSRTLRHGEWAKKSKMTNERHKQIEFTSRWLSRCCMLQDRGIKEKSEKRNIENQSAFSVFINRFYSQSLGRSLAMSLIKLQLIQFVGMAIQKRQKWRRTNWLRKCKMKIAHKLASRAFH